MTNTGNTIFRDNFLLGALDSDLVPEPELLEQALAAIYEYLSQLHDDSSLEQKLAIAFGDNFDREVASGIFSAFAKRDFSIIPKIQIAAAEVLNGANGSYSTDINIIYLSADFLASNSVNSQAIASVLLEEIKQSINFQVNRNNIAGHREKILAQLVTETEQGQQGLTVTQLEDMSTVISNAGLDISLEGTEVATDTTIGRAIPEISETSATRADETDLKDNLTIVFAENLQFDPTGGRDLLDVYGTVDTALRDAYGYLSKFRFDPEYTQKLETAFGTDFDQQIADKLFDKFAEKDFTDIPTIKIVNRADIYGGNGAFSADAELIYLAAEFLNENYRNTSKITDVLLEETGHFVDSQINQIDSPGDEGEIFSNLVQGNVLSEQELQALKTENDIATVISSNQGITVIPGQPAITIEKNSALRVGTWNIWDGTGKKGGVGIPDIRQRINYLAQYGMKNGIDVIALQEIPNFSIETEGGPLAKALYDAKNYYNALLSGQQQYNADNDPAQAYDYNTDGFRTMLNGYKYEVVTTEVPPGTNPLSSTYDGYLILYNPDTIEDVTEPDFFNPTAFVQNGVQYRPPIKVTFKSKKDGETYDFLTWHNEYKPELNAAEQGVYFLSNALAAAYSSNNRKVILTGDFNIQNNVLNTIQQQGNLTGYIGISQNNATNSYDHILTNVNARNANFLSTTGLSTPGNQLYSDAHGALFADIARNSIFDTFNENIINSVQLVTVSPLNSTGITRTNQTYEYSDNQPEPSLENQLIQIGKKANFFSPLTTVDGGKLTIREEIVNGQTEKYINVQANSSGVNAKVYSAIGSNQSSALFNGDILFDTTTLAGTITDKGDSDDSAFKLIGGIEVTFDGLSFGEDADGSPQLRLQGSMLLPQTLVGGNGLVVAINGTDYIGISDNGVSVTGGAIKLPGENTLTILGLLEIKALNAQIHFDFDHQEATLQGTFTIPTLRHTTFNLDGTNYIKIKKTDSGLDFSMVADVGASNIPLFGSWEIQDINLNINTPDESFLVNAKLKTPGSPINLVLAFNQGKLTQITGSSGVGTDFKFLGAEIDIQTVTTVIDRNLADSESWDPELSLQGVITIPQLKGLKGTLLGTNKLVVNQTNAYLTGAQLSADDIQLGSWKLHAIQASFNGTTNTFAGSAKLQTYSGQDIAVSLLFDDSGLKNITASNISFSLFGATVKDATINFVPDRKPNEGDTWDPEFKLQGKLVLPQALGGTELSVEGTDYLLVNGNGFDLTGGKIYKPTLDFNLFGFLNVHGEGISLLYSQVGSEKVFIIQGKVKLPDLFDLTGDFSGSNYVRITSGGQVDVVGSISVNPNYNPNNPNATKDNFVNLGGGWKIKTASVSFDTTNGPTKILANATVEIPSGIDVGAIVLWNNSQLQSIAVNVSDLNKPIGATGAVLQRIGGSYDASQAIFTGAVGITAGPKINLNLPDFLGGPINEALVNLDLQAKITQDYLNATGNVRVLGNLATGTGEVNLNWTVNSFLATANLNILYGLIKADATVVARGHDQTKLDFYAFAQGTVNIPDPIPVIGGFTLGGGGVYLQYIDDNTSSNDYVAAWGQLLAWTVGLKIGFDGSVSLIGSELPALAKTNIDALKANINNPYTTPAALALSPRGTAGDDIINGDDKSEFIDAVGGDDILNGKGGDDILEGGDGNDVLSGGTGKNALNGGAGNDILVGGIGDDIYIFDTDNAQGSDTINEAIIALETYHKNYVQATQTFWNIQQQAGAPTDETRFTLINNGDGTVSLKTLYDRYWSADAFNITSSENLKSWDPQSWEKFAVVNNTDGTISFRNPARNTYVRANTISITDSRWNIDQSGSLSDWEKFTAIDQHNDSKDTLDFSETTTKSINLNLDNPNQQRVNENLNLTLGITLGGLTFVNIENVVGGSLDDNLKGNALDNLLRGNNGNDTLSGGAGNDTLNGGAGNDTAVYSTAQHGINVNLAAASAGDDGFGSQDVLIEIENIRGSEHSDSIVGSVGSNNLDGGGGDDFIIGSGNGTGTTLVNVTKATDNFLTGQAGWQDNNQMPRLLGDVNGDGRADIVAFGGNAVYVALGQSNGTFSNSFGASSSFLTGQAGWQDNNQMPRLLGDVNGDGRADIVAFGGNAVYVALGQSNGTFSNSFGATDNFLTGRAGWQDNNQMPRLLGDVNGDGRADIVAFGGNAVYVALGQSNGTFSNSFGASSSFLTGQAGWQDNNQMPRLLGDVNGDGRADIVAFGGNAVYVALGQSNGTFSNSFGATDNFLTGRAGWQDNNQMPRLLGDVNGDGRADIVAFGGNAVYVALGQSNGTFSNSFGASSSFLTGQAGWQDNNQMPRLLGNVNGDGRADIVAFGGNAVYVALAENLNDGNDILSGGAGNDTLHGGTGNDTLHGGADDDILIGGQYVLSQPGTWDQAQAEAQSLGGNLVTINSKAENDLLVRLFGGTEHLWIGLTDRDVEGAFKWVNGETSSYINWSSGEPNNYGGSGDPQNYAYINYKGAGLWDDTQGRNVQRGIIALNGGNNTLIGDAGNDTLVGGNGMDTFVFNSLSDGIDTIIDFSHTQGDKIRISDAFLSGRPIASFNYDSITGALSYQGQTFAVLNTDSGLAFGDIIRFNGEPLPLLLNKPAAPGVALTSDTGISNTDRVTSNAALTFTGLVSGATVEYSTNSGQTWTTNFTPVEGTNSIQVRQALAGNASDPTSLSFTLDRIAPTKTATINRMTKDTGTSVTDFVTRDGTAGRTYSGTISAALVAASESLQVSVDGGTTWSNATVNNRAWTFTDNLARSSNWTIQARVVDIAGNGGTVTSKIVTLDTTRPTAALINSYTATSINGTTEAQAILRLSTSATAPTSFASSTATADATGNYTLDISGLAGSSAGTTYSLYAQDVAGNRSLASKPKVVVGTSGNDLLTGLNVNGSDLLVGGSGTDTAQYTVASNAIASTGRISAATVTAGSVNIGTANIDVLTSIEQLTFTGTGYTGIGTGTNQLRSTVRTALGNNTIAEFRGTYNAGSFTFGGTNPNATLLTFDSNPGSAANHAAVLLMGKTTVSGSIGFANGTVSLTNL